MRLFLTVDQGTHNPTSTDSLPQSWFDMRNPVVTMDGSIRKDLVDRLEEWEQRAQLVVTLGTSLSGLHADDVCTAAAAREAKAKRGLGLVIVSLTKTPLDDNATLRIYAELDVVLDKLRQKLRLKRFMPRAADIKAACKRSSLFRKYAVWYKEVLDADTRYKRESKRQIRWRAQPDVFFD